MSARKKGRMKEEMQAMAVPMLAGASAGVVSRIICHPIDTIKSKLQVEVAADHSSLSSVLSRTLRSEGVPGLYRGIGSVYTTDRENVLPHINVCMHDARIAFKRPLLTGSAAVLRPHTSMFQGRIVVCLKA